MTLTDYLAEQDVPFQAILHPPAYTASKLAKYLHVSGGDVAKAVLLRGPRGFFVAVLPATRQADLGKLAAAQGGPVRLASTEEIVETFMDCEWGVVSPFGSLYGLPTLLDERIASRPWIVVEAGTHTDAVRLSARDFARLAGCERGDFAAG
ncbi:MAG: YbaK/EbsC family protein [Gemmataceae bacterium]|nr:YbaK/EbsC family protein [Gemmataceae bacterium]